MIIRDEFGVTFSAGPRFGVDDDLAFQAVALRVNDLDGVLFLLRREELVLGARGAVFDAGTNGAREGGRRFRVEIRFAVSALPGAERSGGSGGREFEDVALDVADGIDDGRRGRG